ncbi:MULTISPECIES: erythromycin esterase family protein [unclassified Micromonospora]|uniref:erythromycin esterase family protein n=1 Tax=unclassified Micromonospora TaxID=2617518 RepID=UPI001B37E1F9|nr:MULTISPECIES: erythromycin esterase family protein [unclassified Micromonospora]MBQ1043958.1 erythromycin esterase family protein [Micromonospora sp. C72]MBQ1054751.1 erythromycin esterase family protein [Micromonospora sp. C32]
MNTRPAAAPDPSLAEWLDTTPAGLRPDLIADVAAEATIVGLGVSTREAHEVLDFVTGATWLLVERGFTTVAVLDNQRVADLYDRYVSGQDVDIDHALAQAWGPWQVGEMRDALVWLRAHNRTRAEAPVRIIGVAGARVLSADYPRIVDLLAAVDEGTAARVEALLDVIRVAHSSGEHVLRARGTHPGTPFVELARAARADAAELPPGDERNAALELLDAVVDFHARAIGVGHDMAQEERAAAGRLLDHHRRTGERIVLWEGSTHVAAHPGVMLGAHLRTELGDRYVAVHIAFGNGQIARATIPEPRPDSIEAQLAGAHAERTLHLRTPSSAVTAGELDRSWPTRIISGLYDPAEDAEHYVELPSLRQSFDALVYIPTVTPARPV